MAACCGDGAGKSARRGSGRKGASSLASGPGATEVALAYGPAIAADQTHPSATLGLVASAGRTELTRAQRSASLRPQGGPNSPKRNARPHCVRGEDWTQLAPGRPPSPRNQFVRPAAGGRSRRGGRRARAASSPALPLAAPVLAYAFLGKPLSALLLRTTTAPPSRWRLPAPVERLETAQETARGPATLAGGAPLLAPFTGRGCAAWQIAVLFDAAGDARPPQWVLDETGSAPLEVDGVPTGPDRAALRAPLALVSPEDLSLDEQGLVRFLRQRGVFLFDGDFVLFEASLPVGAEARVGRASGGGFVLRPAE